MSDAGDAADRHRVTISRKPGARGARAAPSSSEGTRTACIRPLAAR